MKTAYFAGGCFWCIEAAFESLEGVKEAINGYTGGNLPNQTYEQVSSGETGHYEATKIIYDPRKITYKSLLEFFWRQINPTDSKGQFADEGSQYRTVIFYQTQEEKAEAENSKKEIQKKFKEPVATEILPLKKFYEAEEYHQDFYKKRVLHYKAYEAGSGRKETLKQIWGNKK